MTSKPICLSLLFALFLGSGCHPPGQTNQTRVYTMSELNELIVPGMTTSEITDKFGAPHSTREMNEDLLRWRYTFPLSVAESVEGPYLAGFQIYIKAGLVDKWMPIMGESRKLGRNAASAAHEREFQIFAVNEDLENVLERFESEGAADLSKLRISPDLAFTASVFAGHQGGEDPGEMTMILVMSAETAREFREFTENHLGRRTLLVFDDTVVAAPFITEPITTARFMFSIKESHGYQIVDP